MTETIRQVVEKTRAGHPGLFWATTALAALALLLAAVSTFDPRTLLGAPLWVKPIKFAISLGLYAASLSWMIAHLRPGAFRITGWVLTLTIFLEMVVIVGQAARGVRSHFNDDTALDAALYTQLMAVAVTVMWVATIAVAVRFLRASVGDRPTTLAARLGLFGTVVGMGIGYLISGNQGHSVGVPDGGAGLLFVNWSTEGGDLRVGHFVGLHALQVLPLLAAVLAAAGLAEATRVRLVWTAGGGYLGLIALVTWQGLRGQPLLAPDGPTLAATAALLAAVAVSTALALRTRPAASDGPPPRVDAHA